MEKSLINNLDSDEESDIFFSDDSLEKNFTDNVDRNIKNKSFRRNRLKRADEIIFRKINEKLPLKKDNNDVTPVTKTSLPDENDIIIPFYSQEIKLSELRKLQCNARKKIKLPNRNKNPVGDNIISLKSNNKTNDSLVSECDKDELYLPLDSLSNYSDSINDKNCKKYCSSERLQSTNRFIRTSRSPNIKTGSGNERVRGKSVSYLEQYRKKMELKNKNQIKNESVCSTIATSNSSCRTQVSMHDIPDTYSCSRHDFCTESEDNFYKDIINKTATDLSPKEYYDSLENIHGNDATNNDTLSSREKKLQRKIIAENKKITTILKDKVKETRNRSRQRRTKSPRNEFPIKHLGTLGPDIETTKPKMESFLKRKEYGNSVSCKNRLEILQKRECYPLKFQDIKGTNSSIPIPVINYSLIPYEEGNQITLRTSSKNSRVKKENKEKQKNCKNRLKHALKNGEKQRNCNKLEENDNSLTMNEDTTEMMLQRHELEKKLAEKIKNQFYKQ